ncbi:trafficking protein particle complex subunit 5-like [Schistocerca gregaria]|uniref:trafficking protein particle complex subunit 5-like n=1 Tax=Schistocerca gregaria TaxID=7010 RepID=UPI00211DF9CC|nr:trafficking protein particle complex subunit 5-like [Schistocerca gregaria]
MDGARKKTSITNYALSTKKQEVSLSAFAFLFSEIIKYSHHSEKNVRDVERRLADMGYRIGIRLLEYITWRENFTKRETKLLQMLFFIVNNVWTFLFNREATLEKSNEKQYMILENESLITKFISAPKWHPNSNFFLAGIVEGILDVSGFKAKVTAPNASVLKKRVQKLVILIEFADEVIEREKST